MESQNGQRKANLRLVYAYLTRAGFLMEAAMARALASQPERLPDLEEAVRKVKDQLPLSPSLREIEALLLLLFGPTEDLVYRWLQIGSADSRAMSVGINGLVDRASAQRFLDNLLTPPAGKMAPEDPAQLIDWICKENVNVPITKGLTRFGDLIKAIVGGDTVLLLEGAREGIRCATPGWEIRAITEPQTESVIRGPREGFTEAIATNLSLVRRRVRDERFRQESMTIGEVTGTRVALLYIRGICKQTLIDEAKKRLQRIKTDAIIDSAYIEEFVEDTPYTLFPTIKSTERPDVVAAALMEGRFAIIVDGSPFALIAPTLFVDMVQAPEDYYERYPIVTMLRLLRWSFAVVALLGPSFYVAFTTFHQEMLPTALLLSIIAAREGVPFPAVIEALMMEIAFEALREAGVRLPKPIGQAVSIVGALVIGQAAVQAGIVSAPMVIVVALTGISSFLIPKFSAAVALRMLRFPMLLLAGTFGAYGITLGTLAILMHLLSLRSFGAPYYAPLGPWLPPDHDDVLLRAPHWMNRRRPSAVEQLDQTRMKKGLRPDASHRGDES